MNQRNRTSPIRSGFSYQDLWGLKLCGELMVNPEKYQWLRFEMVFDEDDPGVLYLDDIVYLDDRGSFSFFQIKYKQDRADKWCWDNFLIPKKEKGISEIKKWSKSLLPRLEKTKQALFITNGQASDEISEFLDENDFIDIEKIKINNADLYNQILKEVGSDKEVTLFFKKIRFHFNQKNIDDLEKDIRNFFYNSLNATESGVTNFLHEIQRECRQRVTSELTIDKLRLWCEFDIPRPLHEQFVIPQDFEFFDNQTHQSIFKEIQDPAGGIKVFFGKPGVGKSVYLSQLDKELNQKGIVTIKHHYHISPEDSNSQERLNADRVIEAIKSQFKSHKEDLDGSIASRNSKDIPLREFVSSLAKSLHKKKKSFVIIIDGLDHVPRELNDLNELKELLGALFYPQPGVWIILGTQAHIIKEHQLSSFFKKCDSKNLYEIKGLKKEAVKALVQKNVASLHLPTDKQLHDLIDKLFFLTQGNPLHLRYSLKQLKNQSGNSLVTDYSCNNLLPYSGDIEKYYESLWSNISSEAKTFLLIITSVNFLFTEEQLFECVSSFITDPSSITNCFNEILHLISQNSRTQINAFHSSFNIFLKNRPEMLQQRMSIKTQIKSWLQNSDYEYLKWAELKIIEYELGNPNPILEIDREWLIKAICRPSNKKQISNQMLLAVKAAFEKSDFAKALQISYLHTYYLNSAESAEEQTVLIWKSALLLNEGSLVNLDLEKLKSPILAIAAKIADSNGNTRDLNEIINVLVGRLNRQEYQKNVLPSVTAAFIEVLPYNRKHSLENIYEYIIEFRDLEISFLLFQIYSRKLMLLGQKEKVAALLKFDLTDQEISAILIECTKYGLMHRNDDISDLLEKYEMLPSLSLIYNFLKNKITHDLPSLPQYDIFPEIVPEHDSGERNKWSNFYYDQFLIGLLYVINGKEVELKQWIGKAPKIWSAEAVKCLFQAAIQVGSGILKSELNFKYFFGSFSDLQELKWPEDRDRLDLQVSLGNAFKLIFNNLIHLKEFINDTLEVDEKDYTIITGTPYLFSDADLIDEVLILEKPLFSKVVYKMIMEKRVKNLSESQNNFPERATDYIEISQLACLYSEHDIAELFLNKSINNLLGYGYHKDLLLFYVLEAIEACANNGVGKEKISRWIHRVIPLIENVGNFTDGDETNNLPFDLADILAKENPKLLYKDYYWYAKNEDLYHAEHLFKYVLGSFSFKEKEQVYLASTALDRDSFLELKKIAKSNPGAAESVKVIQDYLGSLNYKEEPRSPYTPLSRASEDYAKVNTSGLLDHLDKSFQNRWERNNYLIGWVNYWAKTEGNENIYKILKSIIQKSGFIGLPGELLDILYPLAFQFENSDEAFNILCQAQIDNYGWDRHWTDKKKAESRWKFLKEKYPKRYVEFFKRTTNEHIPLTRGVEFFLYFEDLTTAEYITESGLQFTESLMADLVLQNPEWITDKKEITEIDILIQRLLWPSPLIRERAANGIGNLLCFSNNREPVFSAILGYIKNEKMESAIALYLLSIIKAFYIYEGKIDLSYIDLKRVVDSLPFSSLVIEQLILELAGVSGQSIRYTLSDKAITLCPDDYTINKFFSRHIKTFLAPIYSLRGQEIERQTGKAFTKQWCFTADEIAKDSKVDFSSNQVYYYARTEHDKFLLGFSSRISEVYRSAFLRVLQHFYKEGLIPLDFYLEYGYATLPTDLSRWKVQLTSQPEWWPKMAYKTKSEDDKQLTPVSLKNPIEELLKATDNKILLAAEGAIEPYEGFQENDPTSSFALLSFAYKVVGVNIPTAQKVKQAIMYSPVLSLIPSATKRPFHFWENHPTYLVSEKEIKIDDLLIYPLIAREDSLCISLWQSFRERGALFNLMPSLSKDLNFLVHKYEWLYQDTNAKIISWHAGWVGGIKERYEPEMPNPYGQHVFMDKTYLDKWLSDKKLRLGYIQQITYRYKQNSYDKSKIFEDLKLVNVSSIII